MGIVFKKEQTTEQKIMKIQTYKKWKVYFGSSKLNKKQVDALETLFSSDFDYDIIGETFIRWAATLTFYSPEDILNVIEIVSESPNKFGNTLGEFTKRYGDKEGHKRFAKTQKHRSANGRKSSFTVDWYKNKGYSDAEARDLYVGLQRSRTLKLHNKHPDWSEYCIRSNPITVEYWVSRGYDTETANRLRRPYMDACPRSLDGWIRKLGSEENGRLRFNEIKAKIQKTLNDRYGTASKRAAMKGKASKESMLVFRDIIELCDKLSLKFYCGVSESSEYWCRDYEDTQKYYFYDFTIPELDVIIEFNGIQWHPKDKESFMKHGVLKDKYEDLVIFDKRKIKSAKVRGFDVLVIWNDVPKEENVKRCIEYVETKYGEYSQTRRADTSKGN